MAASSLTAAALGSKVAFANKSLRAKTTAKQSQRLVVTKAVISPPNGPLKKAGEKSEEDKLLADADSSSKGLFTNVDPAIRTIIPEANGRTVVKMVYVVLESQYQSSLSAAVKEINATNKNVCVQVSGYLLEELRSEDNLNQFKEDVENANVFISSLIFIEELAEKIVEVVSPLRDTLDACVIFPSMPAVMRLNKLGTFSMAQLGQSKSAIASFMRKKKESGGFEEGMLKLVRTLPKVLKYLPSDKAADARNFMNSLQYWLGGSSENLENFLLMISKAYVPELAEVDVGEVAEPVTFPDIGIWHPMAPTMFEDVKEYLNWYDTRKDIKFKKDAPVIGVVLQRSHLVTGDAGHYDGMVMDLEARGAKVVPVFAGGLDFSVPVDRFFFDPITKGALVDTVLSLTGFALVGGPARQDHPKAIDSLKKLNVPYMVTVPLSFQTTEEWTDSTLGLHPVQVALQVALPELDGGLEPIIFSGRDSKTGKSHSLQDRASQIANRALKWANLRKKKNLDITVFSFPPDKGNVGTAAYLNVFGSIYRVLEGLKKEGYDVGDMPNNEEDLINSVLNDKEAQFASPDMNIEYKMSVKEYEKLCIYQEDLHENWGPPPGQLNTDGQNLLVYGKTFGNVFIGVQPTFGYEGDPMRLLFSKSASPHHGFAAYYTYIEEVFGADAVLHFGTHGSLEFMPGKQVGMSGDCYPDHLIGSTPNIYYYAANNPSEATIAKRRSYANTISYLTPPAENAGLYKGLKELQELISSFQGQKDSARGVQIVNTIVEKARQCNMENDVELPAGDAKDLDDDSRQKIVGGVYRKLMEIESRLLPCGLHIVGCPPSAEEAVATLVNIGSIDRPELDTPLRGMPGILANSVGRSIEEVYRNSDKGELADVELLQEITLACRASVETFVADKVSNEGRVDVNLVNDFLSFAGVKAKPYMEVLEGGQFAGANKDEMDKMFEYLNFCLLQVVKDNEMGALQTGLNGQYVEPGPGGDPIRNPDVLPTGKNIHALDPQAIPTSRPSRPP